MDVVQDVNSTALGLVHTSIDAFKIQVRPLDIFTGVKLDCAFVEPRALFGRCFSRGMLHAHFDITLGIHLVR